MTALALVALAAAGCTAPVVGRGRAASAPSSPSTSTGTVAAPAGCPTSYREPDPRRPVVDLAFTLAADHTTVAGTEAVRFTPDLDVTELVFRLTANTAPTAAAGNRVEVTAATADHGAGAPRFEPAGAGPGTQGGLLRLPFAAPVRAGTTVTARLAFTITLGAGAFDRLGRDGGYAWFGSGQPLLAWERGVGWHTEPMLAFTAESATSEAMDTTLRVIAPAADVVIASGNPAPPAAGAGDTRTWTSHLRAARDVAVAAGPFQVADRTVDVSGTRVALRIGAPDPATLARLVPQFTRALTALADRFGPYPFAALAVARLPVGGGGIEYPGAILDLDDSEEVGVHETAHQWFYGMVGNSQARDAWLDEAFASYAEQRVDGDPPPAEALTVLPEPVDRPTGDWGADALGYYRTTYDKGSAALFAARAASGGAPFDAAVRCYVAAQAWRIARPADVAAALAGLPAAVEVLRRAGALP